MTHSSDSLDSVYATTFENASGIFGLGRGGILVRHQAADSTGFIPETPPLVSGPVPAALRLVPFFRRFHRT